MVQMGRSKRHWTWASSRSPPRERYVRLLLDKLEAQPAADAALGSPDRAGAEPACSVAERPTQSTRNRGGYSSPT